MNEQEAIEVASKVVGDTSSFSEISATFVDGERLESNRAEVVELCYANGIINDDDIAAVLVKQGLNDSYWQVAFFPASSPGSASSARATTVRVDPRSRVATRD